jgi:hypothetical protein
MKSEIIILFAALFSAICSAQNYVEYFDSSCSGPIYTTTAFGQCQNQNFLQFSTLFQCNANNTFSIITFDEHDCKTDAYFAPTALTYPSNKCIYMSGPPTTNQTIYGIGYCNGGQPSSAAGSSSAASASNAPAAANNGTTVQQSSGAAVAAPSQSATTGGQKSGGSRMEINLYVAFSLLTILFCFLK